MGSFNKRFVALPMQLFLNEYGLTKQIHYKDILTYITLRSYYNTETKLCYPSYETLQARSGMGRTFIIQSVKRLHRLGVIDIQEPDSKYKSNRYTFEEFDLFEKIPYEVFDAELSSTDKSMLLLLRFFFNGLRCWMTISEICSHLNLRYSQVYPRFKALKEKGFIAERKIGPMGPITELAFTDKINWRYDYNSKHEDRRKVMNLKVS
jgi:Fic family protein